MSGDFKDVLKRENFSFSKRFGQNFIFDTNLLSAICADAAIGKEDTVVEVGAGAGTLTAALCARAGRVVSFEIDSSLRPVHEQTLKDCDNLEMVYADVLKYGLDDIARLNLGSKYKLVANLPYYITTPVLFHFLEDDKLQGFTVMVQKEVAERLCAKADTPEYGAITAQVAARGDARLCRIVSRNMFTPAPNVDSAVVTAAMQDKSVKNRAHLKKLIAAAFAMRRKTLVNNLTAAFGLGREQCEAALAAVGLDSRVRGETLSIEQFIALSDFLN